jgi:hypothetical protein
VQCAPTLELARIITNRFCGTFVRPGESGFWRHLWTYWGQIQTEKWEAELLQGSHTINTEFTANMMTLSKQVHAYWGCAMCAFRPVSVNEAQTVMHIALHWLQFCHPVSSEMILIPPPKTHLVGAHKSSQLSPLLGLASIIGSGKWKCDQAISSLSPRMTH